MGAFTAGLEEFPLERRGDHWIGHLAGREVRLTNLDKIWFPERGYTKGDIISWYVAVADVLVPHLRGRGLTLKRMPNGIHADFFYEKNAPSHTPDWVPRHQIDAIEFLGVADEASLAFVANLGCIEMHPLHARADHPDLPDYLFFDLDPSEGATFTHVREVALAVRDALNTLELPSFPKTSGATGMQIFVPIQRGPSHSEVRDFVGTVGGIVMKALPDLVTMEFAVAGREGKVFIDHNMNRRGQNIAGVYSVRPTPDATVSMPVDWTEVEAGIEPTDFTITNSVDRILRDGDRFAGVLDAPVDLAQLGKKWGLGFAEPDPDAADRYRPGVLGPDQPSPPRIEPMLAGSAPEPFDDPAWLFEPKFDGVRAIATVDNRELTLRSRSGRDQTHSWPELTSIAGSIRGRSAVIDGEIVTFKSGKTSFESLQGRIHLSGPKQIQAAASKTPVTFVAFDLLWIDGEDLRTLPLSERKRRLRETVMTSSRVVLMPGVEGESTTLWEQMKDVGGEGVMAKKLTSAYVSGKRSQEWLKLKYRPTIEVVVLGYAPGQGGRANSVGSLAVGAFGPSGNLNYLGQVGSGFRQGDLDAFAKQLSTIGVPGPPNGVEAVPGIDWVEPVIVVEIAYAEITSAGKLRAPTWIRVRPDFDPVECVLPRRTETDD